MLIYLSIFLLLLFGILEYDIRGVKNHKGRFFRILLFVFILVSGFAYRLGGDGIAYITEYSKYGTIFDININYFDKFSDRQPGWVLLSTVCKTLTDSFWLFKFVHAIILNTAYFSAIRYNTRYTFSALMVYYILIYFDQNFQVLRESLAISFFLFALPSFYNNRWIKYYIYVLIAMSFHIGAIFLLILPLFKVMGYNKFSILFYVIGFGFVLLYSSTILNYLVTSSRETNMSYDGFYYYFHNAEDAKGLGFANAILNLLIPSGILVYYRRRNVTVKYLYPALFSMGIYILSTFLPIVYRFNNYLLIFNYVLVTEFIFYWISNRCRATVSLKMALICTLFFAYVGFKGRFYFTENYGDTRFKQYVQYYPYASIFEKYEDPQRERLYRLINK